ncbi:MAG: NAD-dependent succinate-semialdehyde dehydrogenase [Schleiferiaceae bacterium]|nr:NAD-dependent succinate-semialdehyde dehydrogenase [Schleiferiaceae bacterium]
MESLKSINPYTQEEIAHYEPLSEAAWRQRVAASETCFADYQHSSWSDRSLYLKRLAQLLESEGAEHAPLLSREMGKPVREARAELEKCAWVCRYYAEEGPRHLAGRTERTEAESSYVRYDPLGPILAIMPWNYPFWQVFRFAAPALMAGNVALLKHAPNVQGCAHLLEALFRKAGFPEGAFQNLALRQDQVAQVLAEPAVKAVSLTGSVGAGRAVAAEAGKHLKPTVLELGGSNAFILFPDADLAQAADLAVDARMKNNAQSCIAAKRFIVPEGRASDFAEAMVERLQKLKKGNPLEESTDLGPLARVDLAKNLEDQVIRSQQAGAHLYWGGGREGAFYHPAVLTGVRPGMPAFEEELFGPVVAIMEAPDVDQAIALSNKSVYGLGVSLITRAPQVAEKYVPLIEDGAVFINEAVKSDPRLPFGGTKQSGYGRELSREGIRAFCNVKTVYRSHL